MTIKRIKFGKFFIYAMAVIFIYCLSASPAAFAKTEDAPKGSSSDSAPKDSSKGPPPKDEETAPTTESVVSAMALSSPLSEGGVGKAASLSPLLSDSFQTDLATGAATANIPIVVPPGRKNMQPNLALSYSSNNPNGICGVGWALTSSSIQRSTKKGLPTYGRVSSNPNTSLLMHFDSDWTDASGNHPPATAYGATFDTNIYKFGSASCNLDGANDYLALPDSDDWSFGSSDFTIDFWVNFDTLATNQVHLVNQFQDGGSAWYLFVDNDGRDLSFFIMDQTVRAHHLYNWQPALNSWYHVALVRSGSNMYLFINGSLKTWTTIYQTIGSYSIPNWSSPLYVGSNGGKYSYIDGRIDELRVSKGVARWTSDFTLPDRAYSVSEYSTDTFIFSSSGSSGELVLIDSENSEYRQKIETGFMRYVYAGASSTWSVWDKNGTKYTFGGSLASRIADPLDATKIFAWHLDRVEDIYGNYLTYIYEKDQTGQIYLSKIEYTGNDRVSPALVPDKSIEFAYETTRPDILYNNRSGWEMETARRLKEIHIKVDNILKWKYVIGYSQSTDTNRSIVSQITVSDGTKTLPPKKFTYQTLE